MLDLNPPPKTKCVLALYPAQVIGPGVILAIPHALTRLLCVHVDRDHTVRSVFPPNLQRSVAQRIGDHRNPRARRDPGPPVAQPIEMEVVHQIWGDPPVNPPTRNRGCRGRLARAHAMPFWSRDSSSEG